MSVYQPLVPSIFQLDLTSIPQYDDKSLDTVYYFIIWFCTIFTSCSLNLYSIAVHLTKLDTQGMLLR